jgi:hypothetical protein
MIRTRGLPGLTLALAALAFPFGSLEGQGTLAEAVMEVRLPREGGPILVTLEYRLFPEAGSGEIGVTLLTPGDTRLTAIQASWGGDAFALRIPELRPHYGSGTVALPSGGTPLTLHLSYVVEGAWSGDGRVTVPIPAVSWIPRDPHPRTFVARVEVPEGLTVTESFPTSVVQRPRGAEGGSYEMTLQGVPSMLVLRVVQGEAPFLNLERVLDILVIATLLVMGAAGVRFLKGGEN